MATIDIGAAALDRDSQFFPYTFVLKDNPANADGSITSVELWAKTDLSNCEVATFIDEGSDTFSTRDYETIGSVTSGSKQTFSGLDMDVQTGDYIGTFFDPARVYDAMKAGAEFTTLQKSIRAGAFQPERLPDIGLPPP